MADAQEILTELEQAVEGLNNAPDMTFYRDLAKDAMEKILAIGEKFQAEHPIPTPSESFDLADTLEKEKQQKEEEIARIKATL
jgi:hypothetical protein